MRYTTVIDITELPAIYRSQNARLLYLHMALKCGYHDSDRDIADVSVRRLAADVGVTVSAVRHALRLLERSRLIEREAGVWRVKKWIQTETITPRKNQEKAQKAAQKAQEREIERQTMERQRDVEREQREQLESQHTSSFIVYYEGLIEQARNGDVEAAQLLSRRRAMYESECSRVGHQPIELKQYG